MDFFTVPTLSFRVLYCLFVIEHGRRPFPFPSPYRYVLLDRDAKFSHEVLQFLRSSGLEPIRTSVQSPWQNGVAERWIGSIRRELLDHVIPLHEFHLRRVVRDYLSRLPK